jgi:hypothetical protein
VEIHALTAQVSRENHHYPIKSEMIGARLFVPNFSLSRQGTSESRDLDRWRGLAHGLCPRSTELEVFQPRPCREVARAPAQDYY